jgi:phosphatidylinositol alpha-1,6-mannosyltransferase
MADRSANPVRLLAVTPDFPPVPGGIQVLAHRLLDARRLSARVVTLGGPGAADFDRKGELDVRRVDFAQGRRKRAVAMLNLRALAEGLRTRPEVVLSMHVVTAPGAWGVARLLGIPLIQYIHTDELRTRPGVGRFALRRASAVVAVSRHAEEMALRGGADPGRLHRIPPGVQLPEERTAQRAARPTFVTVARLEDRYKGHDVVLRALPLIRRRVPEVQWVVVGEGTLRHELEDLAERTGVRDCVTFTGQVTEDERERWLDRAHVFVMPSRLPEPGSGGEGFGIAFMEASAHGLPVVAGNVAGALDAVVDGRTGLLVDPTSPEAVADAVAGLLMDRQRAEVLGRAGIEHANQYAWPLIAERLEKLVLDLVRPREEATSDSPPDVERPSTST